MARQAETEAQTIQGLRAEAQVAATTHDQYAAARSEPEERTNEVARVNYRDRAEAA